MAILPKAVNSIIAICVLVLNNPDADPTLLEQSVIEYRRAIPAGHIELHSRVATQRASGVQRIRETTRVAYFDGEKLRVDLQEAYNGAPPPGASVKYWDRRVRTAGTILEYTDKRDGSGRPYGVRIAATDAVNTEQATLLDARFLGVFAAGSFSAAFLSTTPILMRPDVSVVRSEAATHAGTECHRIDYVRRDGSFGSIWIDPERGPSVVRAKAEYPHPEKPASEEIICQIDRNSTSGYWFPTRIEYLYRKGEIVTQREVLDIKVISLGKPLPPETFTFAGLGLQPGKEVGAIGFPNPVQRIWTGKELVPMDTMEPYGPSLVSWPWVLGWLAVIAGIILLIVVYRRRMAT